MPEGAFGLPRRTLPVGPVVFVASADATNKDLATADYVCSGTADQTQINAALAALPTLGGSVLLSAGTFSISAPIKISQERGLTLRGSGWATKLNAVSGLNTDMIQFQVLTNGVFCEISHLRMDGHGDQQTAGNCIKAEGASQCLFNHLYISAPWDNAIYLHNGANGSGTGNHNRITNCLFDFGYISNGGNGRGILIEASDEAYVAFCDFEQMARPAATEPHAIYDRSGLNSFIGNVFVTGSTGIKLEGNHSRAIGNMFDGCGNHAIQVTGNDNLVVGNTIDGIGFGSSAGTIDGVNVNNSTRNLVANNSFLSDNSATRCGVNFVFGATGNLAYGNSFAVQGSGYASGPIGLGTGNRALDNLGYNKPILTLDPQPVSPNAANEEMLATTSGLTFLTSSGSITNGAIASVFNSATPSTANWNSNSDFPGALVMQPLNGQVLKGYKAFAPAAGTAWAVACKVRMAPTASADNPRVSLVVTKDATPSAAGDEPTDGIICQFEAQGGGQCTVRGYSFNAGGGSSATNTTSTPATSAYLGIVAKTDNSIQCWGSYDGVGWFLIQSYSGLNVNGAVANAYIAVKSAAVCCYGVVEWLRFLSGSNNLLALSSLT